MDQALPRAGPIGSGGGEGLLAPRPWSSTRLARPEGCDDMPTPMSVWSMGLTSSGHPWAGPGSPTASLRHRRLRMAGSRPQCPVTHRRPQYPTGSAGRGWPAGAVVRGPSPKEPPAAGPEWARGAEWSPRTELDIGADERTST